MYPIYVSLLVHFVGIGLLFTALIGTWVVGGIYRAAPDWQMKALHLKTLRRLGLMSPIGVVVMVVTGIGNMTLGPYTYTLFSDAWLSAKLALFVVSILLGILSTFQAMRRSRAVNRLAAGETAKVDEGSLRGIETQLKISSTLQFLLILAMILLSIARPLG